MRPRPIVLVICDFYLPGYESGGAVRTLANMIERLGGRYDFRVITRDRDGVAVKKPYSGVAIGEWNVVGNAKVYYLRPEQVRIRTVRHLINEVAPAVLYLNSFFSPLTIISVTLQRLGGTPRIPTVLAPEGEFSAGALSLRRYKKKPYLAASKMLLPTSRIVWKAASEPEAADISRRMGKQANVAIAPNMPPRIIFPEFDLDRRPPKIAGKVRMIFLSRFMRKKNFNWLFPTLQEVSGNIDIDICGTLEEPDYWEECRQLAGEVGDHIRIRAIGPVPHEQVQQKLSEYDFFILPTLGENFGHVFIEAFASGLPVMTSDRTPWNDLQSKEIGWDLSLERRGEWATALAEAVQMDADQHRQMCLRAREFALAWLRDPAIERSNVAVIEKALADAQP